MHAAAAVSAVLLVVVAVVVATLLRHVRPSDAEERPVAELEAV